MKCDLFGFGEKIVGIAIQSQFPDSLDGNQFFGNKSWSNRADRIRIYARLLRRIDLHAEFPFGKIARFNRVPQIAAVKIRVKTGDFLRFVPRHRMHAEKRFPVKFNKRRFAFFVDKTKRVNAEAFHHSQTNAESPGRTSPT